MPYSTETERRKAEKAWKQRNSDGKATNAGPPGFALTEAQIELDESAPTEVTAVRHEHTWSVEKPDWLPADGRDGI
jgi:hypothetical protein